MCTADCSWHMLTCFKYPENMLVICCVKKLHKHFGHLHFLEYAKDFYSQMKVSEQKDICSFTVGRWKASSDVNDLSLDVCSLKFNYVPIHVISSISHFYLACSTSTAAPVTTFNVTFDLPESSTWERAVRWLTSLTLMVSIRSHGHPLTDVGNGLGYGRTQRGRL